MCDRGTELLHDALNLAIRSDQFEQQARRDAALSLSDDPEAWQECGRFDDHVSRHNGTFPHSQIAPRSLTMHLWVMDQYERDLADWQSRARAHLTQGCPTEQRPKK